MRRISIVFLPIIFLLVSCHVQFREQSVMGVLPGFSVSPYFDEQVKTFILNPEVRIHVNAPSRESFDPAKPTELVFFALPNGNTIEQTAGKKLNAGDDWHYDIQHIAAQTRYLRTLDREHNIVTIYLEADAASIPHSWPAWRSAHADNAALVRHIVDSITSMFARFHPFVVLTGHSGGGGFTFSDMSGGDAIPNQIKRIAFLDSDYNYDNTYGSKLAAWLNAAPDHYLSVLAYNDSIALYNGKPVVSPTGGTWYKTHMMVAYLSRFFDLRTAENDTLTTCSALNGRIRIILRQNPSRAILHTIQVELNGFIQTMLSGTDLEGKGYAYYGPHAYSDFIQPARPLPTPLQIPPRPAGSMTGSQFMASVDTMNFTNREREIYKQIAAGNIPDFMRRLKKIQSTFQDANGVSHNVIYEVMPDYLCIGSDADFCRIPMGPVTAQRLANLFGATMPTSKLVDDIYVHADVKLYPISYTPIRNQNELVSKFVLHNSMVEALRDSVGKPLGSLVAGTEKDVVISNKITDPAKPNHVVIYGWHRLNGIAIQPLYNGHINWYVDYSHGIRLVNREMLIDSVVVTASQILADSIRYKILSNESGPMMQAAYPIPDSLSLSVQ